MINETHNTAALAPARPGLLPRLLSWLRELRALAAHRRAMADLLGRDARLLQDIGLDRGTVAGHYDNPRLGLSPDRQRRLR
ncbi:hypothetical protein [Zavarzinia compransoris]|uniref:DUF1127 domain-containing protein n=1 Tax=Zavarzinia compransoris TaxID=1264899 RepID=A0A317DW18_9PROT|nr:hypothetical protein [Zavarzinia compransoris]PWR18888.1 hypothetical protein DKG75_18110 [Zavarzinia compransoris]TDP48883.1 hypothetical protein DES42_101243 [Zavarzinia compransoris]